MECLLCGNSNAQEEKDLEVRVYTYDCKKCGIYALTSDVQREIINYSIIRNILASLIRERKINGYDGIAIFKQKPTDKINYGYLPVVLLDEFLKTFPNDIFEKMQRCLLLLSKLTKFTGQTLGLEDNDGHLFFLETDDIEEFNSIFKYMRDQKIIEGTQFLSGFSINITLEGWKKISELKQMGPDSNQVFVAMWFSEEMEKPYVDAISKAIENNGYTSIRIDKIEHNNKIDDEIIANIRKSKFVVADFTGHRGGVYFEAGYAMGLGLPVIWTCRKDHIENLHFDTRQYSHLVWESEEELYRLLDNRIKATIISNNAQ